MSRAQLRGIGLGEGSIDRRVRAGRLIALHRGVYAVGHDSIGEHGRWMAAVLACGDRAALSHRSAAELLGLGPEAGGVVDVMIPVRSGRRRPGIRVHRSYVLPRSEVGICERIPVTSPARTLLDLAAVLGRRAIERAVDDAERLKLFDLAEAETVLNRHPGHWGTGLLGRVLREHRPGSTPTRNDLEERFLALCDDAGVPRPVVNQRLGPYVPDFLWRDKRLVVETDGASTHRTRAAFEHDRARDARLTVGGYRVVRFTHDQVMGEASFVVGVLRSLLGDLP